MITLDNNNGFYVSTVKRGGTLAGFQNTAVNATTIIYTIPANREFLITRYWLNAYSGPLGQGYISIFSPAPALLFFIDEITLPAAASQHSAGNIIPAMVIPAGYSIRLTSSAALFIVSAGIIGYQYPIS